MATATKRYYTEAEYLARERPAEYKSEYYRGEIFAMAGATREHNLVVANVVSHLHEQLRKTTCEVCEGAAEAGTRTIRGRKSSCKAN